MSMPFIVDESIWPPEPKVKKPTAKVRKSPGPVPGEKKARRARIAERVFNCEADLSTAIITKFNQLNNVKCQKIKGTAYGKPTLDILGSRHGRLFWLEVKQPGEKPTRRQYNTMQEWIDVGCIASWTTSVEGAMRFLLEDWRSLTNQKMLEGFHV